MASVLSQLMVVQEFGDMQQHFSPHTCYDWLIKSQQKLILKRENLVRSM